MEQELEDRYNEFDNRPTMEERIAEVLELRFGLRSFVDVDLISGCTLGHDEAWEGALKQEKFDFIWGADNYKKGYWKVREQTNKEITVPEEVESLGTVDPEYLFDLLKKLKKHCPTRKMKLKKFKVLRLVFSPDKIALIADEENQLFIKSSCKVNADVLIDLGSLAGTKMYPGVLNLAKGAHTFHIGILRQSRQLVISDHYREENRDSSRSSFRTCIKLLDEEE